MTSSIRTGTRSALATALLLAGVLACSGEPNTPPTLAGDLQGDLEAAQSSSIELANGGARRTQVVSAEELTGAAVARAPQAAPRAAARRTSTSRTPAPSPAPSIAPAAPTVVVTREPAPPAVNADTLAPIAPRPTPSRPTATPSRPGGYKSVSDVMRDAPFPINP